MKAREIFQAWSGFWRVFIVLIFALGVGSGAVEAKVRKNVPPPAPPVEKVKFGNPMTFWVLRLDSLSCEPNCPEWIQAEGEITDQTPAKLKKLLANKDYRKLPILLNSPGGRVEAAMEMGRLIRKYGMSTAVGWSNIKGCIATSHACVPDGEDGAKPHLGYAFASGSFCNSACPLMLMGGVVRVAGPGAYLGLHQPVVTERWIDYYRDTWRMVNGKKVIISHKFVKRVVKPEHIVGVKADTKSKYLRYFKEMGGTPQILDEMAKASPEQMNNVPQSSGLRQQLGLVSANDLDFSSLVSLDHCKAGDKSPANCVYRKDGLPQPPQAVATPCFILGGCGGGKSPQAATKGVPCFKATGCSDADKLAAQEWLNTRGNNKDQGSTIKGTPCFTTTGCSEADKIATQEWLANRKNSTKSEATSGTPCFTTTGCSEADKMATQEWLANRKNSTKSEVTKGTPCFIESGCNKSDIPVTKDAVRNGEPEMSFRVMRLGSDLCEPRCPQWIAAEGWITKDTAKKFQTLLSKPDNHNFPIFLQSHGGDLNAAMEMGRIVHENNLDTTVAASSVIGCPIEKSAGPCIGKDGVASSGFANAAGSYCERACTAILLGGTRRIVEYSARVGVEPLSPDDRIPFEHYLIALNRSFEIVREMDAARLSGGFNSIAVWPDRKRTGLLSDFNLNLYDLIGSDHCKTYGKLSANCVEIKEKEPQTAVAP